MAQMHVPNMLHADLRDLVVLVRMDHNVVKKGIIKDTMRIDATIPTLLHIFKKGGMPVLMTHVGRPLDKKTGEITISEEESVVPIVRYLKSKYQLNGIIPDFSYEDKAGITDFSHIKQAIKAMKAGKADFVYLPNTRWYAGEEAKDERASQMAEAIAEFADIYINDAFGSWQAHTSTVGVANLLPSYAGLLMLKEISNLQNIFDPNRPLVSVVAGSKFDTKIGPLSSLIKISDYLILGGVIYNAYLCVKYGISIKGVGEDDINMAKKFIADSGEYIQRIVELPYIVESDSFTEIGADTVRTHFIKDLKPGTSLNFVLDADPKSMECEEVKAVFAQAQTVFINAVMGYTALFQEGTKAMYRLIDHCPDAIKLYGGGDTIQELKDLLPDVFSRAINDEKYYFFSGGGAILDAIEKDSPYEMKPIQALISQV